MDKTAATQAEKYGKGVQNKMENEQMKQGNFENVQGERQYNEIGKYIEKLKKECVGGGYKDRKNIKQPDS